MPTQEVSNGGREVVIQRDKSSSQMIVGQALVPELRKDLHIPIHARAKGSGSDKTSCVTLGTTTGGGRGRWGSSKTRRIHYDGICCTIGITIALVF